MQRRTAEFRWTVQQGREVPVLLKASLPAQQSVAKTRKDIQGCLVLLPVSAVTTYHKFSGTLRDLGKPKEGFQGLCRGATSGLPVSHPLARSLFKGSSATAWHLCLHDHHIPFPASSQPLYEGTSGHTDRPLRKHSSHLI